MSRPVRLGQSLQDLGEEIGRTGHADPEQIGSVLLHVGAGVSRLERRLATLRPLAAQVPALLERVECLESALRQARARHRARKFTD